MIDSNLTTATVEEEQKLAEDQRIIKNNLNARDEEVKQIIIKACRTYLQENKCEWTEEQSQTSNSYYFHIIKGTMVSDWQTPVIRISDHKGFGKYRLAEFLFQDIGKHKPTKQIKKQVIKELEKGFRRLTLSGTKKAFESLM